MIYLKVLKRVFLFLSLLILLNCKSFNSPISLAEAASIETENYFKVKLNNGDVFTFEKIEFDDENYVGINIKNGVITKTPLIKENIKTIQEFNKKSPKKTNILGVGIGIGSLLLGVLMF